MRCLISKYSSNGGNTHRSLTELLLGGVPTVQQIPASNVSKGFWELQNALLFTRCPTLQRYGFRKKIKFKKKGFSLHRYSLSHTKKAKVHLIFTADVNKSEQKSTEGRKWHATQAWIYSIQHLDNCGCIISTPNKALTDKLIANYTQEVGMYVDCR